MLSCSFLYGNMGIAEMEMELSKRIRMDYGAVERAMKNVFFLCVCNKFQIQYDGGF